MSNVLLITGASSDIGVQLIKRVEKQYDVILAHYYSADEELVKIKETLEDKMILLQADFTKKEDVLRMLEKMEVAGYEPNHIVHLPSEKMVLQRFHKTDWEDYEKSINISVASIVMILKYCIPKMIKKKSGKIVFMLSSVVENIPPKYSPSYVLVKYALLGLMRGLSQEYADKNITVNGISPHFMETKFWAETPLVVVEQHAQNNPLGRNLMVNDVIPAIEYLLSGFADAITGENICITGGTRW